MRVILACLLAVVSAATAAAGSAHTSSSVKSHWTWRCESGQCIRHAAADVTDGEQLSTCKLTCGQLSALWPRPTGPVTLGKQTATFLLENVSFRFVAPPAVTPLLEEASRIFLAGLRALQPDGKAACGDSCAPGLAQRLVQVVVAVDANDTALGLDTSEYHQLLVNRTDDDGVSVLVYARTFFGARHGLETVSQLIDYDAEHASMQIVDSAMLSDDPVYPIRALTLDTSRNFISLAGLRRTVDAMAMNKLNTLHWHVTDTDSFPIEVAREPRLAQQGAYSPEQVYSAEDVRQLVQYARQRGVRLIPELDAPAHVGYGWQWGEQAGLGKLAVCVGREPWQSYCVEPPCGQMNIVNDNLYTVLEKIYADFNDMFEPAVFHMGGDEINFNCWKTSPEISEYVKQHGGDPGDDQEYMKLWADYQVRAAQLWRNATGRRDTPLMIWTSDLTKQEARQGSTVLPPSEYIVQVWTTGSDEQIGDLLKNGYPIVMSNYDAWYLDCGFSAWVGAGNNWCTPYKSWQTVYDNSPRAIAERFQSAAGGGGGGRADYVSLVRGGAAALWSEQSDDQTLDTKLWPRGAALAERLWAEPTSDSAAALSRLVNHRERMVRRGVGAESLQPQYCHQNDGRCVL